jgi:hypothetical protein
VLQPRTQHTTGPLFFVLAVGAIVVSAATMALSTLNGGTQARPAAVTEPAPASAIATPIPVLLHSKWVAQSAHPTLALGEVGSVWLSFRNTGIAAWAKGSPAEARLGLVGSPAEVRRISEALALDWVLWDRPAVQDEAYVSRGAETRFTFKVKGTKLGTYRLNLRPVVDGVAWLEEDGAYVDVTVR